MDHSQGLTLVDLVVIGIVALSAVFALARGIVREILSLATWVGAGAAAAYFYPDIKPWMHQQIANGQTADIAAGVVIFVGALIILIPLGIFLAGLVRGRALTAIDRSLGFVYGLLRGAFVVCLLYLVAIWVWPDQSKEPVWLAAARTRPLMVYGAGMVQSVVPRGDFDKASDVLLGHNETANENTSAKTPEPGSAASPTAPGGKPAGYDDQSRSDLNHLINQPPDNTGHSP